MDFQLQLQICLYFNVYFVPLWFIIQVFCLINKFHNLTQLYKVLLIAAIVVSSPLEVLRLYLGYSGNLMQRVPELAGFWLLTLLLRFPLHCWLIFSYGTHHLPAEKVVNFLLMLFLIFEVLTGYVTLKRVSQREANKFKQKTCPAQLEPLEQTEQTT